MAGRVWQRAGCVVSGAVLSVGVLAAPAWAPKYIFGAAAFGTCDVDGSTYRFIGSLTVQSFTVVDGALHLTGVVGGTCADTNADTVATVELAPYDLTVVSVATTCTRDNAGVEVRPGRGTVDGLLGDRDPVKVKVALDLSPSTVVERTWVPGDPPSVRGRLCAVHYVAQHRATVDLAGLLNRLVLG